MIISNMQERYAQDVQSQYASFNYMIIVIISKLVQIHSAHTYNQAGANMVSNLNKAPLTTILKVIMGSTLKTTKVYFSHLISQHKKW